MVTLTCDRCDRKLEVPDEKRGSKIDCPYCGDTNLVPAAPVAAVAAADPVQEGRPGRGRTGGAEGDRPTELGLPPDLGPEQRVMLIRPAMFRARPALFSLLALLVIGGAVGAAILAFRQPTYTYAALAAGAAVIGLVCLGVWKLRTMFVALEITNKRTIETRGLFSRATSEVLHDDIKNLQITQSFWQRVWGVGEIGISSAGQSGIEIHTKDMPRPMEIKRIIDAYRNTLG